jgi:hypothetical protein
MEVWPFLVVCVTVFIIWNCTRKRTVHQTFTGSSAIGRITIDGDSSDAEGSFPNGLQNILDNDMHIYKDSRGVFFKSKNGVVLYSRQDVRVKHVGRKIIIEI